MSKSIDQMTAAELRALADEREEQENNTPKKKGFLKKSIYIFEDDIEFREKLREELTAEEGDKLIEEFRSRFKCVVPKGTEFHCFKDGNSYGWFDTIGWGIEDRGEEWAAEFLENIQEF